MKSKSTDIPFGGTCRRMAKAENRILNQCLSTCIKLVEKYGFKGLKLKGGVLRPEVELNALRRLRKQFGDGFQLRFDPNAAWSVETSIRILRQMEELNLEYVEDPTWGIEGMSLVRGSVRIPLATNMGVIWFDQIPSAIRANAIDIIMGDIHYWGGFQLIKRVVNIAETFMLGASMHSDRELGVSTAALLHFMASNPYLVHGADSHYHHQLDDVIESSFEYQKAYFKVPDGPGLGVTVDNQKLKRYHNLYEQIGEADEFVDPRRPGW